MTDSPPDDPRPLATACPACATPFTGDWCARCGEKRLVAGARLPDIVREAADSFLELEQGFPRTFVGLLRDPKRTVDEYLAGIRRAHCSPVRFFLWMILIVVVEYAVLDWALPPDFSDPRQGMFPDWFPVSANGPSAEMLATGYAKMMGLLKVNLSLQPIAWAGGAWVVFLDRRRPYAEHLVFALYGIGMTLPLVPVFVVFQRLGPWWMTWLSIPLPFIMTTWFVARFHDLGLLHALARNVAAYALMFALLTPSALVLAYCVYFA